MVTVRRTPFRALALVAIVLVAVAGLAAREWSRVDAGRSAGTTPTEQDQRGIVTSHDLVDAIAAPAVAVSRTADLRLLGLWVLPGLAAALAAHRLLRRQLTVALVTPRVRADRAANRAPPSGSIV